MESENTSSPVQNKPDNKNTISIPAAIITGAVIIALAVVFTLRPPADSKTTNKEPAGNGVPTSVDSKVLTIRANDHVSGNRNASIVIFEYSDGDCPFCERFHPTMKQIVSESNGDVAWVYRHFPLSIHPNAFNEAVALECAANVGGNEAFWNYLDATIDKTFETTDKTAFESIAGTLGLNKDQFARCLRTNAIAEDVRTQAEEAQSIGARGTPFSIVVNMKSGKQAVVPGAYPIEELRKHINSVK